MADSSLKNPAKAEIFPLMSTTKASMKSSWNYNIPVINLSDPEAKQLIVKASEEFGFFKVVNHGVNKDLITRLESEAIAFFALPQPEKDKAAPPKPDPFGYGNKNIGFNGDFGWVEYLLFPTYNPNLHFPGGGGDDLDCFRRTMNEYVTEYRGVEEPTKVNVEIGQNPERFRDALREYVSAVKKLSCELLELMVDGLMIQPRKVLSKYIMDEESESFFRINHYPPCPEEFLQASDDLNLVGFGEHTDPQIISVLRANEASGYEILLRDGTWFSVPPDENSFFINIGDSLQVMTNGRFRSVRHRVSTNGRKARLSMIYFGGTSMKEKIGPLPSFMGVDQPCLYKELTWFEYKSKFISKPLSHNRLVFFEKTQERIIGGYTI